VSLVILGVGLPLIALTAMAMFESEWIAIIKELIQKLVKTTNYATEQIIKIIHLYG
jgi:hypothetical protein